MKTDYVDLWQVHALETPERVEERVRGGMLDALLEAQETGKVRHIGFTGHDSFEAHLKMLEEIEKRGMKMAASMIPINPADPHFKSFVTNVLPRKVRIIASRDGRKPNLSLEEQMILSLTYLKHLTTF